MSEALLHAAPSGLAREPRVAQISGLGHHVPTRVVPNGPIAERIGVDEAWIVRRTGIESRRWAGEDETLADMSVSAGERALADADLDAGQLDLVLVATMSQDDLLPHAAPTSIAPAASAPKACATTGAALGQMSSALIVATSTRSRS